MYHRQFKLNSGEICDVLFDPGFDGMATVSWGSTLEGKRVEIPAIVLTLGISDIADRLSELSNLAQDASEHVLNS